MKKTIHELITDLSEDTLRVRSAARLMSLAESSPQSTVEILSALASFPKPRIVLGITGAPGSGKSVLTGRLVSEYRTRHPEKMIGVIAVDPSSPFTGGALLGDRIRMMEHATDSRVFIRSLATHGQLGGITIGTLGVIAVMGAIGCDVVIVETVGVGQMEFAVKDVADMVAIVLAPGQGDTIQFLKAGLMEIGDIFIVNKSDRPDFTSFHAHLLDALRYLARVSNHTVCSTCARDNRGVKEFVEIIEEKYYRESSRFGEMRGKNLERLVRRIVLDLARDRLERELDSVPNVIQKILSREITVTEVADKLFQKA